MIEFIVLILLHNTHPIILVQRRGSWNTLVLPQNFVCKALRGSHDVDGCLLLGRGKEILLCTSLFFSFNWIMFYYIYIFCYFNIDLIDRFISAFVLCFGLRRRCYWEALKHELVWVFDIFVWHASPCFISRLPWTLVGEFEVSDIPADNKRNWHSTSSAFSSTILNLDLEFMTLTDPFFIELTN